MVDLLDLVEGSWRCQGMLLAVSPTLTITTYRMVLLRCSSEYFNKARKPTRRYQFG